MYDDSIRNKINMIGAYLILNYDINDEKAAKLMTIAKSNSDEKSKSAPFDTDFFLFFIFYFFYSKHSYNIQIYNIIYTMV